MRKLTIFIIFFVFNLNFTYSAESDSYEDLLNNQESVEEFKPSITYDENHFVHEIVNMLLTLAGIIVLLVGFTWVIKGMQSTRIKYNNISSLIKVIDYRALSTKTGIYLIHVENQAILLADSHNGVTHLATFPVEKNDSRLDLDASDTRVKKFEM